MYPEALGKFKSRGPRQSRYVRFRHRVGIAGQFADRENPAAHETVVDRFQARARARNLAEHGHKEGDVEAVFGEGERSCAGLREAHVCYASSPDTSACLLQHLALNVNQKQMTARNRTRDTNTEVSRSRPQLENPRVDIEMKPRDKPARRQNEAAKRHEQEECELMRIGSTSAQPA